MKTKLKNLRPIMDAYRWSVEDVASFCGVTRAAAHSWLTGKTVPTLENLGRLATLFRVQFVIDADGLDIYGPEAYNGTIQEGEQDEQ